MRYERCTSHPVQIWIAGDYAKAKRLAQDYCDRVGLCVTVTKTEYVYTGGSEKGVCVGLINYPRFPTDRLEINVHAKKLGMELREGMDQSSFSIQNATETTWYSWRPEDNDSDS